MENNLLRQWSVAMGLDTSLVQLQNWDFRKLQLTDALSVTSSFACERTLRLSGIGQKKIFYQKYKVISLLTANLCSGVQGSFQAEQGHASFPSQKM